jgi:hypothetical protein
LLGAPTLPAWQRYTGVVWDHLDIPTLTASQRTRALNNVVVVSGLLGCVRASDSIPDYRLKMGARLAPFGLLSKWWMPHVSTALEEFTSSLVVVDLLPQEHRAALDKSLSDSASWLRVSLNERSGAAGGHDAKAAKGRLARLIIEKCAKGTEISRALASFRDKRFVVDVDWLLQFGVEEVEHLVDADLLWLFGEHGVIALLLRRKLDGDERVPEQRSQRVEARADQLVAGIPQSEHLATRLCALTHPNLILWAEPQVA